jgi:hypothetical protein
MFTFTRTIVFTVGAALMLIKPADCFRVVSRQNRVSKADAYRSENPINLLSGEDCNDQSDCFNCTLSGCRWADDSYCDGQTTPEPGVKQLFKNGISCGDPLNLCMENDRTSHYLYKNYQYQTKLKNGQTFPWGYFCFFRLK